MASLAELEQQYEQKVAEREALNAQYQAGDVGVLPQIQALNVEIAALAREISSLTYPTASAAADVKASDDAAVQNPQAVGGFGQPLTFGANGRIVDPNVESGTNPPVITTIESQSVNNDAFGAQYGTTPGGPLEADDNGRAVPGGTAGVAAPPDDSGSRQVTSQIINSSFNGKITPQPNVLDQYASYTYSISWYLMAPNAYKRILETGKVTLGDFQLLVQSGGAPVGSTGGQSAQTPGQVSLNDPTVIGAARSPYFQYDYYIDSLDITNVLTGKGRGDSTNLTSINFTITEPLGITLIGNLRRAVEDYYTKLGTKTSWMAAEYALIIRFYGYDSQGRPVQVGKDRNSATDSRAVVEKFYPFNLNDIKTKPSASYSRVTYNIVGAPISHNIGYGTDRNVIRSDTSVSGRTVRDVLVGNVASANQPSPETDGRESEASSAPQSGDNQKNAPSKADGAGVVKFAGLAEALNKYQRQLVNQGVYEVADEYEIDFFPKELGDSLIVKDGTTNYSDTPLEDIKNASQAVNPEAQNANMASRTATAYAGTAITQFIDQQMRNSQYVTNQSKVYFDEVTGERKVRTPGKEVAWFRINVQATPKTEKVDKKRGEFAYKVKYLITPFNIVSHTSDYFPDPVFKGLHKSYKFWFTGENTQVLGWDLNYNLLYQSVMSDSPGMAALRSATNNNDIVRRTYQPFSNQSAQGAEGKTNEIAANLADSLYEPNSLHTIKLKIVGDPAWLQQGEVATGISEKTFTFRPFNDDGTINFQAGDVVFDVTFARPQDYDLNTGLADPAKNNTATNNKKTQEPENVTYYAKEVKSQFRNGQFEQILDGTVLLSFPQNVQTLQQNEARPSDNLGDKAGQDNTQNNLSPNVRVGDGVVDAQRASGTTSSEFTGTQYSPNLISSEITSLQTQTNDTADGSVSIASPSPQAESEPAESNGDVTPRPVISSAVTDAQALSSTPELAGPPRLPSAEDTTDWDNIPSYEIRGTSESLKQRPVTDQDPQLMNKEY